MSRKKSKHRKEAPLTNPNQKEGQQGKQEADVRVHGTIETYPPQRLLEKQETERKEDATQHTAERKEDKRLESKKLLLERLTFGAVAIYAFIAAWQGILTRMLIKNTQANFIKDQRPFVYCDEVRMYDVKMTGGVPTGSDRYLLVIGLKNSGRTQARRCRVELGDYRISPAPPPGVNFFPKGYSYPLNLQAQDYGLMTPTAQAKTIPDIPASVTPIPTELVKDLLASKAGLCVYGNIRYCDIFGIPHLTQFCQQYKMFRSSPNGKEEWFDFGPCVMHNCDDDDCPDYQPISTECAPRQSAR